MKISMDKHTLVTQLREEAARLGFDQVGIARAERLDEEAKKLEQWLSKGYQGSMHWMENHFEKRVDPTKLVPGAKSVISLVFNYHTDLEQNDPLAPKISKYAYGEDYHFVLKRKLKSLLSWITEQVGEVHGRCFVDSAPVMEREWARRSGLGWLGKNTLLIHPKKGSYYFLAEIILDLELPIDHPIKDYCGTCRKCIDACPTNAFSKEGYLLDASKCISYLTIELKEEIPDVFSGQMEGWAFGCDICQEVCPWNRFAERHKEPTFEPREPMLDMSQKDWEEITVEVFNTIFKNSPVKRTKLQGLQRNIRFLKKKSN
jgi:epoxyqueuosine reductase